jgi:hypothetical protein
VLIAPAKTMEPVEMGCISRRRRRDCCDGGGCWAILGESGRSSSARGLRLAAGLVVVTGLALLALPAALILDDRNAGTGSARLRSLAESSTNPSAAANAKARRLNVAKSGERGRNKKKAARQGGAAFKGLFSADGLWGSKTEKEKLLLTLLKNLEQVFPRLWDMLMAFTLY